jgi:hypothetical protein
LQSPLDLSDDHLDRDRVVAATRYDHVRVSLTRLNEFIVHWLHGGQVLIDDFAERPATLLGVALDSTNQTNVRVGVDENLDIA